MTTRYTDGSVTIELDDGLARFVQDMLTAAERETVRVLETAAEEVAVAARADWYGAKGVERETGRGGDVRVVSTYDAGRGEVRVSVGSADTRKAGKGGKPLVVYVHRPGRLSMVLREVEHAEWWRLHKAGKPVGEYPLAYVANPAASDGKFLLAELVRTPMKRKLGTLGPALAKAIATRVGGG